MILINKYSMHCTMWDPCQLIGTKTSYSPLKGSHPSKDVGFNCRKIPIDQKLCVHGCDAL